jgi:hypothetical protein
MPASAECVAQDTLSHGLVKGFFPKAERLWTGPGSARGSAFDSREGTFVQGETVRQHHLPGYEHVTMDIEIVEVTPERTLARRWHPYAIAPK